MQQKTRYVSIQLGIGGFQPMLASEVDKLGYGDCKALSNYMKALLKVVDINAVYTLIGNGSLKIEHEDFSSADQMNHAILCVPLVKDTVWLECTSQRLPSNYISSSNANRFALLIDQNGGQLVKTPIFSEKDNFINRKIKVDLKEDGSAICQLKESYGGLAYDRVFMEKYLSEKEQKEATLESLNLSSFSIEKIELNELITQKKPHFIKDITLKIKELGSISGQRMFLPIDIEKSNNYRLEKPRGRNVSVQINEGYTSQTENVFTIPVGWKVDFIPLKINYVNNFGSYQQEVILQENTLLVYQKITLLKGLYPAETYEKLYNFFEESMNAQKGKIILIKK
jgi:hypothetical protein